MTAPHTHSHTPSPPEAPPRPPPVEPDEQPGPSRARWIAAIVILVVAGGLVGWSLLRGGGGTVEMDPNRPWPEPIDDTPADTEPDSQPADGVDPKLAELRATDRYLEIAEHERASEVEAPGGGDSSWTIFSRGGYTNTATLWDEVVRPIRDDALLAGEPYTEAMWDEEHPVDAYLATGWNDETTQGRGDVFVFTVRFVAEEGEPVERIHAVLIHTDDDGAGEVAARMGSFDVHREDALDFPAAAEASLERVWTWVQQQPVEEGR